MKLTANGKQLQIFNSDASLPIEITAPVKVPPIKCQGIKTKLVPFILKSIKWDMRGKWIEPFIGSGVVLFNLKPAKAYASDTNEHLITFYKDVQNGKITADRVKSYLEYEGKLLMEKGQDHYYYIRERFNNDPNSLDFLFLSRSCFNGVLRFNKKGKYNVPFCRKTERFSKSYITKIVNQVRYVSEVIDGTWEFVTTDWKNALTIANKDDFIYADPPYIGRHTDYYGSWDENDANELNEQLLSLDCGFALSTWKENSHRSNIYLQKISEMVEVKTFDHYYHVGAQESNRGKMVEALAIKRGYGV